jgi:taurine dioxygenase
MTIEAFRREALSAAPPEPGYRRIEVRPLTGALGAEIVGADLTRPLDDDMREEILAAFDRHLVVYFKGQGAMTPEQHIAFASIFGPLQRIPHINSIEGWPDVQIVRRMPEEKTLYIGEGFHADSTFLATPPTTVTMRAVEVPPYGGDTAFQNMYLAYETLSPGMQALLSGLKGVHSASKVFGKNADQSRFTMRRDLDTEEGDREVVHPLVRTHPRTGRKSLFINRTYLIRIDGLTEAESQPILDYLRAHAAHIAFGCRVRWENGMVLVWDNRCTHHSAIGDYNAYRYLERVTTGGEVPV